MDRCSIKVATMDNPQSVAEGTLEVVAKPLPLHSGIVQFMLAGCIDVSQSDIHNVWWFSVGEGSESCTTWCKQSQLGNHVSYIYTLFQESDAFGERGGILRT